MNKLEKKFITFTYKRIADVVESIEWRYYSFDPEEWTSYGVESLKETRYDEIQYFIDRAKDRGVNENVLAQLQFFNNALFWESLLVRI